MSNTCIDPIDAVTVDVVSYVTAWHELAAQDAGTLVIHGRYLDRFRRVGDGWLIDARKLEVHGGSAPAPFHPLERVTLPLGPDR